MTNPANLLTPDPKEVASFPANNIFTNSTLDVDLGAVYSIDSLFLGFINPVPLAPYTQNAGGPIWLVTGGAAAYTTTVLVAQGQAFDYTPSGVASPIERHVFVQLAAPVNVRYIRFSIASQLGAGTFDVGALAIGKAWQTTWGHEWGAGRPVGDTSTVERLFGGGFGINAGATSSGYQWTFGDLLDQETRDLHALLRRVGKHGSILVVEDPDLATVGLNERVHWGLFDKLEPYERLTVGATKWGLRIEDWA